ncbi:hypothetical protein D3C85_1553620 [compost metagenome]
MVDHIHQVDYIHLSEFVEIREQYMNDCKGYLEGVTAVPQKYRDQIQRILAYDPIILERLASLKEEAFQGMQKTRMAKQQQNMYETSGYASESHFFDKKK